jgi:hypothetical protein
VPLQKLSNNNWIVQHTLPQYQGFTTHLFTFNESLLASQTVNPANVRLTSNSAIKTPTAVTINSSGQLSFIYTEYDHSISGTIEILAPDNGLKLQSGELLTTPQSFSWGI